MSHTSHNMTHVITDIDTIFLRSGPITRNMQRSRHEVRTAGTRSEQQARGQNSRHEVRTAGTRSEQQQARGQNSRHEDRTAAGTRSEQQARGQNSRHEEAPNWTRHREMKRVTAQTAEHAAPADTTVFITRARFAADM
ncbi:hypothetical protein ACOMHN_040719 [Nucella lapillus]